MPVTSDRPESSPDTSSEQSPGAFDRTTVDFVAYLRSLSIDVRTKDGKLLLNAPAGALTVALQGELRLRKPQLLAYLTEEDSLAGEIAPLTFAQQRLWLIDRFTPGTIAYNVPQSWRVRGAIDLAAFHQSIKNLTQRHDVLRTRIEMRHGEPVQVVLKDAEIPVEFTDLGLEPDREKREALLKRLLIEQGRKEIPLGQAPLIRFRIIRLAPDETVIFYSVHHIVVDQWSLDLLKRDLALYYEEAISGQPSGLTALSVQYADIARQERNEATERLHASRLQYWRDRLSGMPTLLEFPFSKTRPGQQTYLGETLSLPFDPFVAKSLRQFAVGSNTSLYLLMLAMFSTLIYRYTGQRDFCIGTPTTGRKQREHEEIIGLFVNMLPVRCIIDPTKSFHQLLQRMRSNILTDLDHGDVPFQMLVTELHSQRSSSSSPLFQISFALNPKGPDPVTETEAQQETFIGAAKFDLTLQVSERAEALDAHFEYRTDLFAENDIRRFADHFFHLVGAIVKEPNKAIATLSFLTPSEIALIEVTNRTEVSFDRGQTLVSLVAGPAQSTQEAAALCCGEVTWSYRELHHRSTQLASVLQSLGVGPETFVAICLERSPHLIVAILAVLKTGAAYLPLDPKYPADRIAYMLEDSGAKVLVASDIRFVQSLLSARSGLIVVDPVEPYLGQGSFQQFELAPESAAYLIYTSGSTGKPKGVVVEHRNAVALISWAREYFEPSSLRGMLASTSVCFDLSIFEIFLPLVTGNTIILVDDLLALPRDPHAHRVTLINTVPSAMSALLQSGLPANVQTVCMAGEFLPGELVDRVYAAGAKQVIDLYGPTETTTYSTVALRRRQSSATIGQPIANTRIYLVDENLELVPSGLPGEMLIGGEGVTRGYLNRPELTSEKFVSMSRLDPRGRLYRTGDLAQQRDDGMLVYLGRRDQQIKLRGHRIELGEIESVLRESTGASQVAVVLQKGPAGDSLAGFLVHPNPESFDQAECTESIRRKLPAYMVPASISCVADMPLTPNGKIDRKLLMNKVDQAPANVGQPPRDLLEQWLANIWSSRLGQKKIARDAHFFDQLGGHSLVAFEIFTEIEQRIGVAMMLATLFQTPTVELLAQAIRRHTWKQLEWIHMQKPGFGEPVTYLVGDTATVLMTGAAGQLQRIMMIDTASVSTRLNETAAEIVAFEGNPTSLVLAALEKDQAHARELAQALTSRGFKQVSIAHLEA